MVHLTGWRKTLSEYFYVPQRWILAVMGFLAIANAYTMRIVLSIAITQMVVKPNNTEPELHDSVCPADDLVQDTDTGKGGQYDWSQELQGMVLSSFYIGYMITHIPGGILAEKFGGKWTLALGILSTAVFTFLTPLAVELGGAYALIALRILMGLGEGTTFPALSVLLASWIPSKERSKLGSLVFGGGQIGTVVGTLLSGFLLHNYSWHSVFYFFGGIAMIWFIFFIIFCYSDPGSHPFIRDSEREYLKAELGQLKRNNDLPPTPWVSILTSAPTLALVCAQIGHDWGFYVMVTDLPKYMSDVLRFSIKDNGIFSSLPYLVMWIVSISTGFLSDWLISSQYVTITNARKIFTAIAALVPGIFILGASYAHCDKMLVVACFTLAMGFMGTFYPGLKVNPLDLSPNYAGSLMAVANGIGSLTGIIAPYAVGVLTPNSSIYEWRIVFWISFVIFFLSTVAYVIWASGEVQPWNYPKQIPSEEHGTIKSEHKDGHSNGSLPPKT